MYNWVVRRVLERTSAPQAVYPQVVDTKVRTWMPAVALLAASFVTPARAKMDVRYYDWSASPASWIKVNLPVGPTQAQIWPAVSEGTQNNSRTIARPGLDVRAYAWSTDFGYDDSQTIAILTPVNTPVSYVTADHAELDVRRYEWAPVTSWIFKTLPTATTAQLWPAISEGQTNYRTVARPSLDVRGYDWATGPAWVFTNLPVVVTQAQLWPAIAEGTQNNYRTTARAALDVRSYEWSAPAWIFTNLPAAVTQAQLWPAISEGTQANYRTIAARSLDVRSYEWAPEFVSPIGQLAPVIAAWGPAFATELASYRTGERARLEPRAYDWSPEPAFIFASLPAVATVAQTWPAIQGNLGTNYRTAERARLDVRRYDWRSDGPYTLAASNVIRTWAPVFSAELASFRTGIRPPMDVRIPSWLPTYTGQLLPTFRTWWAANSNQTIGPLQPQPETY